MIRLAVAAVVGLVAGRVWSSTARQDRDDALTALAAEQTRRLAAERQAAAVAARYAHPDGPTATAAEAWLRAYTAHPTHRPPGEQTDG